MIAAPAPVMAPALRAPEAVGPAQQFHYMLREAEATRMYAPRPEGGPMQARIARVPPNLGELRDFGLPLLVGTSRKSAIGAVLDLPEDERAWGTAATVAVAIANGADIVRVHDVAEMAQVCKVADAIVRGR